MDTPDTLSMLDRKPLLILIDGHALVYRAWHAMTRNPLTLRSTGEDVRAVYGFLNIFLKSVKEHDPTHIAITFDVSAPTFRHERFAEYKAHRPPMPLELRPQFERIKNLMRAFRVPIFELPGYEADDLLGTLCRQAQEREIDTIVLTGDTDTLQLVSPWVKVLLSRTLSNETPYDVTGVKERYGGLGPEIVADIKALEGDSSDNIPGVPRVGRKTAIKLLSEYGSIQGIYDHLDEVKPPSVKKSLTENRDVAFEAQFLTTIHLNADVTLDMDECRFGGYSREEVIDILNSLEFRSMIDRIPVLPNGDTSEQSAFDMDDDKPPVNYTVVDTDEDMEALISAIDTPSGFSFDTETTSKDPMLARLVGLSFSTQPYSGWYVPVGHADGRQLPLNSVLDKLKPVFANPDVPKTAHNANYDIMTLENHGVKVEGLTFDTMLAAHLTGEPQVGLKDLALKFFGETMTPIADLIGRGRKQITMAEVEIAKAAPYAAADADFTERLKLELEPVIEGMQLGDTLRECEMPLVSALTQMQRYGVAIDVDTLKRMSDELSENLNSIRDNMYQTIGHQFNLNSSQQLGGVLFDELRLPTAKKKRAKSGSRSTNAATLDDLKHRLDSGDIPDADPRSYDVMNWILEHRQLSKLKSTYVDALPKMVNPETGRIHTKYNQTGSATGRISSNDPNVQNIPVRTELGRQVRKAFVAPNAPETILLAADYSQIELRVLAHYSKDPHLLDAFRRGEDIHSATSSLVYDVPISEVTSDMRRFAKILNFGVLYGLTAYGISRQTDLSPEQGQNFIDLYFDRYPGIREYVRNTIKRCQDKGYVETKLGRRRYLPNINVRNFHLRQAAERAAINMPIQGTAADIIKTAMIRIMERMDELRMSSKMILQVHDELIFETPRDELERMKAIANELMPTSLPLNVPLAVEIKTGYTWGDME